MIERRHLLAAGGGRPYPRRLLRLRCATRLPAGGCPEAARCDRMRQPGAEWTQLKRADMASSRLRVLLLAALALGPCSISSTETIADCINCVNHSQNPDIPVWSCELTPQNGGTSCQTLLGGCLISGNCIYTPPPPPPPPPPEPEPPGPVASTLYEQQEGIFDLGPSEPCDPLCDNFPASVPLAEAFDFASIRTKVARLSGKPVSSIGIKAAGYFFSTAESYDPGTAGWVVRGWPAGFMYRRDLNPDGSLRLRVCRFGVGGTPEVVSDQTLSGSGTLLVRFTVHGRDIVYAFKEEVVTWSDWAANHVSRQQAWQNDFQANATGMPWAFSIARASGTCE